MNNQSPEVPIVIDENTIAVYQDGNYAFHLKINIYLQNYVDKTQLFGIIYDGIFKPLTIQQLRMQLQMQFQKHLTQSCVDDFIFHVNNLKQNTSQNLG
jgi:hypothetical protein